MSLVKDLSIPETLPTLYSLPVVLYVHYIAKAPINFGDFLFFINHQALIHLSTLQKNHLTSYIKPKSDHIWILCPGLEPILCQRYRYVGEDTTQHHKIATPTSKPTIWRVHPKFKHVFIILHAGTWKFDWDFKILKQHLLIDSTKIIYSIAN